MADNGPFPSCWTQLRDPCPTAEADAITAIEVCERDWQKIVWKHFANSTKEPWRDVLGHETIEGIVSSSTHEVTQAALAEIRNQIAASLLRPLVILYSCIGPQIRGIVGHRWLLVLPCGAVAVVWAGKSENLLKTCYITGRVARKTNKSRRWRHSLRQQVEEYSVYDEQSRTYYYPSASHLREVSIEGASPELRYAIQFSAADAWGFASNKPGAVWQTPNWDWSDLNS